MVVAVLPPSTLPWPAWPIKKDTERDDLVLPAPVGDLGETLLTLVVRLLGRTVSLPTFSPRAVFSGIVDIVGDPTRFVRHSQLSGLCMMRLLRMVVFWC